MQSQNDGGKSISKGDSMNADKMIQWLLDEKLVTTRFDKFLNEQMIEISTFGIEINTILNKLKSSSKEAQETNEQVAEKMESDES